MMRVTHKEPSAEEAFGAQVRFAREAREWTQDALARHLRDASGVSMDQAAVARLELGKRAIRLNEAVALASLLGLDLKQYGGKIAPLSDEQYPEALEHLDKVQALEQQASDALTHVRRTRDEALSRAERDLAAWREERIQLEAAIQEYERRAGGE
jgi:transcriptional regulator with XRE-family HTH domain